MGTTEKTSTNPIADPAAPRITLVKQNRVFQLLPDEVLHKILDTCRQVSLEKDQYLIQEGEDNNSLYLILYGEIEISKGKNKVDLLKDGELLGEMAMIDMKPRSANAKALRKSLVLEIDDVTFRQTVGSNHDALWELLRILVERIRTILGSLETDIMTLSNFTHDIKNCLVPLGYVEFWNHEILKSLKGTDEAHKSRKGWETAQKSYDTVSSVKHNLLSLIEQGLARVKKRQTKYIKAEHEVKPLIEETIREISLHKLLAGKNIELEIEGKPGIGVFNYLDIKRVLQNLLVNAGYETKENGRIVVHLKDLRDLYQISVQDFGAGIPTEIQPYIFKEVYTSKSESNGFGLLSCKEIIEDFHKGKIWYETVPGKGTIFHFQLQRFPAPS